MFSLQFQLKRPTIGGFCDRRQSMSALLKVCAPVLLAASVTTNSCAGDFTGDPLSKNLSYFQNFHSGAVINGKISNSFELVNPTDLEDISQRAKVLGTIHAVISALSDQNFIEMSKYYADSVDATFMGPILYDETGRMVGAQRRDEYFRGLATSFSFFRSVKVSRNNDEILRVGEHLAIWTGTGHNFIVWRDGRESVKPWRWTVVLERSTDGVWIVIHDHSSFGNQIPQ